MGQVVSLHEYRMRRLNEQAAQRVMVTCIPWPHYYQLMIFAALMRGMFGGKKP